MDCMGPSVPGTFLVDLASQEIISTLDNNDALNKTLEEMAYPTVEMIDIPIPAGDGPVVSVDEGEEEGPKRILKGKLYKPPGHNPQIKRPLVLHV